MRKKLFFSFIVFILFFFFLEAFSRIFKKHEAEYTPNSHWQSVQPYTMFNTPEVLNNQRTWFDSFQNKTKPAIIIQNKQGFPSEDKIDYSIKFVGASDEELVIITGGSAAWGVGASSNSQCVDGALEKILNKQGRKKYKVINMAMGGWKSEQEFIALANFGKNFNAKWIVCIDGVNDIAVAVAHSQGAGYPMYYASMDAFFKAYCFNQLRPVFFRGYLENEILKYSYFARWISGNKPIIFNLKRDYSDPQIERSIVRDVKASDSSKQLAIYIQMLHNIALLFPKSNVIYALQPVPFSFSEVFHRQPEEILRPEAFDEKQMRLNKEFDKFKNQPAGLAVWPQARRWFLESAEMEVFKLSKSINTNEKNNRTTFTNLNAAFPETFDQRIAYFIDPVHCNDAGYNVIAEKVAKYILGAQN